MTSPAARPQVALLDGRIVSSWSQEWLAETLARHNDAVAILRLPDRDTRRIALAAYAIKQETFARVHQLAVEPAAYAAEARRRLEVTILDTHARWAAAKVAAVAATAT